MTFEITTVTMDITGISIGGTVMKVDCSTFVVLDVPEPTSSEIRTVREYYKDTVRLALPIEITVAGSSGVGPFVVSQDLERIFSVLDDIAKRTAPVKAEFADVLRFPSTNVFVLTVKDESPFVALHKRIISSGFEFYPINFPYRPHCTLVIKEPDSAEDVNQLMNFQLEHKCVKLDRLSVYGIKPGEDGSGTPIVNLLHRTNLSGT